MKKYEDFMRIRFSKMDAISVYSEVGYKEEDCKGMMFFSKILVQFASEEDAECFDDEDIYNNITTSDVDYNDSKRKIFYADNENAFADLCEIYKKYDCDVYQFIIDNN